MTGFKKKKKQNSNFKKWEIKMDFVGSYNTCKPLLQLSKLSWKVHLTRRVNSSNCRLRHRFYSIIWKHIPHHFDCVIMCFTHKKHLGNFITLVRLCVWAIIWTNIEYRLWQSLQTPQFVIFSNRDHGEQMWAAAASLMLGEVDSCIRATGEDKCGRKWWDKLASSNSCSSGCQQHRQLLPSWESHR